MSFVVFSLPRSRSAWLSVLLSRPGAAVAHDLGISCASPAEFAWKLQYDLSGTCETGAAFAWPLIQRLVHGVRFATVRRPVEEVCASLHRLGLTDLEDEMRARDQALDDLERQNPGVPRFEFKDLIRPTICAALHQHCTGRPMDGASWAALDPLNIQVDMARRLALLDRHRPQIEALKARALEMMADG